MLIRSLISTIILELYIYTIYIGKFVSKLFADLKHKLTYIYVLVCVNVLWIGWLL